MCVSLNCELLNVIMAGVTFVERNLNLEAEQLYEDEDIPKISKFSQFIRSRRNRLIAFIIVFTLIVPVVFYYFLIHRPQVNADEEIHTCAVNSEFRIPCFDGNLTERNCLSLNCCFDYDEENCYHSLPSRYHYRRLLEGDEGVNYVQGYPNIRNLEPTIFGSNISFSQLHLRIRNLSRNHTKVTISTSAEDDDGEQADIADATYYTKVYDNSLGVDIFREEDETLLLTTGLGPLIASERYWELSFFMGSDLFGLDRLYFTNNETYTHVIYHNKDNHTTIPAFMAHRNGTYHGLLFEISGPVEFMILPSRLVSVRVLGGEQISFTLMTGPTPQDVQQQFYQLSSEQSVLPKRWLLQPHICRSGAGDLENITAEYRSFKENGGSAEYVSDCLHDNLYYMLFEISDNERNITNEVIEELKQDNEFILTVYPQILYGSDLASKAQGLLYEHQYNDTYIGMHLDRDVVYLDYNSEEEYILNDFYDHMMSLFNWLTPSAYSLKDNWPLDETFEMERIEEIPYINTTFLEAMSNTIPWNATATTATNYHYQVHNSYADKQVRLFRRNFADKEVWSSSYNFGMEAIAQVQHLNTSWTNLRRAIRTTLLHGLFASPLISIPVCGSTSQFDKQLHEILCSRWYITAATFPTFTVSSDFPRRDHLSLNTGHSRNISLDALAKRKMFMPYYYTTLAKQQPITRPMFYDFYKDNNTFALEAQYMVGDSLIVAQPLTREARTITVYLPPNDTVFYEFFGGERFQDDKLGNVTLSVIVESDWIVFFRGGKIIPLQTVTVDGDEAYTIAIAPDLDGTAEGSLFFNEVFMAVYANTTHITLSNLGKVPGDLNCQGEVNLPSIIHEIWMYGNEDTYVTLARRVDLCSLEDVHVIDLLDDKK